LCMVQCPGQLHPPKTAALKSQKGRATSLNWKRSAIAPRQQAPSPDSVLLATPTILEASNFNDTESEAFNFSDT